nr:MAG TPA: hypothetical protein [Herelleviridae sp.]
MTALNFFFCGVTRGAQRLIQTAAHLLYENYHK